MLSAERHTAQTCPTPSRVAGRGPIFLALRQPSVMGSNGMACQNGWPSHHAATRHSACDVRGHTKTQVSSVCLQLLRRERNQR